MREKSILFRTKLLLMVFLGLISMGVRCSPPRGREAGFFPSIRAIPIPDRPPAGMFLWLEGGPSGNADTAYMRTTNDYPAEAGHRVDTWHDVRWSGQSVFGFPTAYAFGVFEGSRRFEGQVVDVPLIGADGVERTVRAVRCGTPNDANTDVRCSYQIWANAPFSLDGFRYTILAVVRRISGRGSNYFIMSDAGGRCANAGGTGCPANSVLHLGWEGETTARLGHYYNDSTLEQVPAFTRNNYPRSVFVGRNGAMGKQVALLQVRFNFFNTVSDTRTLENSGNLFVGGTPWGSRVGVPDWRFVGDILAVLVYLTDFESHPEELLRAQAYLRAKYGPE